MTPAARPHARWVVLEAHARGLTRAHPGVAPERRGTFAALGDDAVVEHLLALGVDALELQPVTAFTADPPWLRERGLTNFWGYDPDDWTRVHAPWALDPARADAEFDEAVARLDHAGIAVLLDVVFNHVGGGFDDRRAAAGLAPVPRRAPDVVDVTGCGHSVDTSRPEVRAEVVAALTGWRRRGVAGFRFDLLPALLRDADGIVRTAPLLADLAASRELTDAVLIAEPWDLGPDGHRTGRLPPGWWEWNDRARDDLRRVWCGLEASPTGLVEAWRGSPATFRAGSRPVDLVTCHDGFTLADVVAHERRHNEANGEDGRDGRAGEPSVNCGVEGPSDDPSVVTLRRRLGRAMAASVLVGPSMALLRAGDEVGHSQGGNSNAWCQDNPTGWVDWSGLGSDDDLTDLLARFTRARYHAAFDPGAALDGWDEHGAPWPLPEGPRGRRFALRRRHGPAGLVLLVNALLEPGALGVHPEGEDAPRTARVLATTGWPDELPTAAELPPGERLDPTRPVLLPPVSLTLVDLSEAP